jgi:glycerophosphoryl diester phosphodiesterase
MDEGRKAAGSPWARGFTLICHRGGKGFGPENTLQSLAAALDFGVEALETDVRMSEDGVAVIHHGPFIGLRLISRMSFREIRKVAPEIPTLEEYLDLAGDRCFLNLEIKKCHPRRLAETISTASLQRPPLISSFDAPFLDEFRLTAIEAELGLLVQYENRHERMIEEAKKCGATILLPASYSVNQNLVEDAHSAGLRLITWTVNNMLQVEEMIAAGVDGIITDFYRELLAFLETSGTFSGSPLPLLAEGSGKA